MEETSRFLMPAIKQGLGWDCRGKNAAVADRVKFFGECVGREKLARRLSRSPLESARLLKFL